MENVQQRQNKAIFLYFTRISGLLLKKTKTNQCAENEVLTAGKNIWGEFVYEIHSCNNTIIYKPEL